MAKSALQRRYENLKRIFVCANHFLPEDIETKYSNAQPDGSLLEVERANPHLRKDAVPRFLPGCPSYLSSLTKLQRLDHSAREQKLFYTALEQSTEQ